MSEFVVKHATHSGLNLGEIKPENLTYGSTLNDPGTINYEIDLTHQMASPNYTNPYATDFILYKDDIPIMGGLHTEVQIEDVSSNTLSVSGKDWLHYFEKRQWPFNPADPLANTYLVFQQDIFVVVQYILNTIMADSHSLVCTMQFAVTDFQQGSSSPNFSGGPPSQSVSNTLINYQIEPGDTEFIFSKIQTLAKNNPGFDFDVTWDKMIRFFAPKKGFKSNYTLEQDINCSAISFNNVGPGATKTLGLGSAFGTRTGKIYYDEGAATVYRRLDTATDFGEIADANLINNLTTAEGQRQALPIQTVSTKWVSGDDFWDVLGLGDMPRLKGDTGYTEINDYYRIVGLQSTVTNEGDEEITITFDDGSLSL